MQRRNRHECWNGTLGTLEAWRSIEASDVPHDRREETAASKTGTANRTSPECLVDEEQVVIDLEAREIAEESSGILRWKLEVDDPFEGVAILEPPT
jgi:hypothetical protein